MSIQETEPGPAAGRITRLTILCRGATAANLQTRFSSDDPLLVKEHTHLGKLAGALRRFDTVLHAPERSAVETAGALSGNSMPCAALRDVNYGRWNGQRATDIAERSPEDLQRWREDPFSAPHGGESFDAAQVRAVAWLQGLHAKGGNTLAVTHAVILKLLFLQVVGAPLTSIWHIDVEPLGMLVLTSDGRRWTLRRFGPGR